MPAPVTPDVAIVVAARDMAEWLPATLQSVLAQTYRHDRLEVVVVDDGSTDGTGDLARQVLDAGVIPYQVLTLPASAGPSAARNAGWRQARARWIQFLDADDLLDPCKLTEQVPTALSRGQDVGALSSRWGRLRLVDGRWQHEGGEDEPAMGDDPIAGVIDPHGFVHVGAQLINRDWLDRVGGWDQRLRLIEDVDLQLRLLMEGAVFQRVKVTRPVFWYRQRPGSLSQSSDTGFVEGCVRNLELVEGFWRRQELLTPARRALLAASYFDAARQFADRNPAGFENLARRVFTLCPDFVPAQPVLRALTRVVGYRRAEQLAVRYRKLKRLLQPVSTSARSA